MAAGCGDDTVRVAFRPEVDRRYIYQVRIETESRSDIEGRLAEITDDEVELRADHTVIAADRGSSRVQVRLRLPGAAPEEPESTFVVALDPTSRRARLDDESEPTGELGELGLAEIFPAAAGATPQGRLSPGHRWTIDEAVELPGLAPTRLHGRGRLAELAVVDGRSVGLVERVTEMAVESARAGPTGVVELRGVQRTRSTTSHNIDDGAVQRAASVTTGEFDVELLPPSGDRSLALRGTMSVRVRSTTRRLG